MGSYLHAMHDLQANLLNVGNFLNLEPLREALPITIMSKEEWKRMHGDFFEEFFSITNFLDEVAGQSMYPLEFANRLEQAHAQYNNRYEILHHKRFSHDPTDDGKPLPRQFSNEDRWHLMYLFFLKHPQVLIELEKQNKYTQKEFIHRFMCPWEEKRAIQQANQHKQACNKVARDLVVVFAWINSYASRPEFSRSNVPVYVENSAVIIVKPRSVYDDPAKLTYIDPCNPHVIVRIIPPQLLATVSTNTVQAPIHFSKYESGLETLEFENEALGSDVFVHEYQGTPLHELLQFLKTYGKKRGW